MAAPRAGRNGRVYIDTSAAGNGSATPVSQVNKWSISQTAENIDVTSLGDTTKVYVKGVPDASGSFDGWWDGDSALVYNLVGSSVARKFYLYPDIVNDGGSSGAYWYGTIHADVSTEGGVDGAVAFSGTWVAASVVNYSGA